MLGVAKNEKLALRVKIEYILHILFLLSIDKAMALKKCFDVLNLQGSC
jgi:hypothetical protein